MNQSNNTVDTLVNAAKYVRNPSLVAGDKDFYPLPGKCQGPAIDLSGFHTDTDYAVDFNGMAKVHAKGSVVFRGAYAGEEANPRWRLADAVKPPDPSPPSPAAMLVWIDPASSEAGTTKPVTLTGMNFTEGVALAFNGAGITADNVTVDGPTRITARIVIAPGTPPGTRQLTVTTPLGSSNALGFRVMPRRRKG